MVKLELNILNPPTEIIDKILKECDELVAIFVKSIDTAQKNKANNYKK